MPDDGELTLRPQREGKFIHFGLHPLHPPYRPILPPFSSWAVRKLEPIFFSPRVLEFARFEPVLNLNLTGITAFNQPPKPSIIFLVCVVNICQVVVIFCLIFLKLKMMMLMDLIPWLLKKMTMIPK